MVQALRNSLQRYRKKRDFARTPEPSGDLQKRNDFSFVVQKHAARRLHYDFRLALDGVMKSWAVTKGPSLDPAVKRLAVHVEDHPIDYASFEGIIPKGEYGGGTVMVWDRGHWRPEGDPHHGLNKGHLAFTLEGARLKGGWDLVRMGKPERNGRENWLLIKRKDGDAKPGDADALLEKATRSVSSKRTMDEISNAGDSVWHSNREARVQEPDSGSVKKTHARRATGRGSKAMPEFVEPELATLVDSAPKGDQWLHEIKFDGYRVLARLDRGEVRLFTRSGLDWTARFPRLASAVAKLSADRALIDGELVVLDTAGVSSFSALQDALKRGNDHLLVYYAFDLLYLDGKDLREELLEPRKEALRVMLNGSAGQDVIHFSDHQDASGPEFLRNACRLALEGVVSKRRDSIYRSGRGRDWLKSKCIERQEFVIGGFTPPTTGARGVGALLLGYFDRGALRYVGRVGTGFTAASSGALRKKLDGLVTKENPFAELPTAARRGAKFVEPTLVAEIEFRSWTADGRLRHASYQGLREDKEAKDVTREEPAHTNKSAPRTKRAAPRADPLASLSHPDRVLYPEQGITKRGLAEYYLEVADWILPHVADRPLSFVRCPSGRGKCFYQKHLGDDVPKGLEAVMIRQSEGKAAYAAIKNVDGLISLVQLGVLEIHPWGTRATDIEHPDRLIFDFDPDTGLPWVKVVDAAKEMRERLKAQRLESFLKTTGGKGLHVVVPIVPRGDWDRLRAFAKQMTDEMVVDSPALYVGTMTKSARKGKIFIDHFRNGRGATAIAPYSSRARENAPVATPLHWEELGPNIKSDHFTITNLPRRLTALYGEDPWKPMLKLRQALPEPRKPAAKSSARKN